MRIAVVGGYQEIIGGAESYLTWLLSALVKHGHQLAFAFERPTTSPEHSVDRGVEPLLRWNVGSMEQAEFLEKLSSFQPDVVFLQTTENPALDMALAKRFRVVLFAHAFYGACATGWRVHRIPQREICSRRFGLACLPMNYLRGCGARNPIHLAHLYQIQRGRANVLPRLAKLVVASEYMRAVFIREGVPAADIHVIPPPVEFAPDPMPPEGSRLPSRVLFLGRLTTGKGAVRGIQAVARCQQVLGRRLQLTIAGTGPELDRCKRAARRLGIDAAFPGWVDQERRLTLLRNTDLLIVPSVWAEPFGMVGIEAASAGVPAVAYPAGGIVDWLRPGTTGELARGRGFSSRVLAAALERALIDPEHHHQLKLGAWRMAHEFSGERHLTLLEELFLGLQPGAEAKLL